MEWNISKYAKRCLSCDINFKENDEFYSTLLDNGSNFERKDFCLSCWEEHNKESIFSFWKCKIIKNQEQPRSVIDITTLLDLFFKLEMETEEKPKINLRYVLALFLMRKKLFTLKQSKTQDGNETLLFHYTKENRDIEILNPKLTAEEIALITDEVKTLFDNSTIVNNS